MLRKPGCTVSIYCVYCPHSYAEGVDIRKTSKSIGGPVLSNYPCMNVLTFENSFSGLKYLACAQEVIFHSNHHPPTPSPAPRPCA